MEIFPQQKEGGSSLADAFEENVRKRFKGKKKVPGRNTQLWDTRVKAFLNMKV